jgi:hypothetical protein
MSTGRRRDLLKLHLGSLSCPGMVRSAHCPQIIVVLYFEVTLVT